VNIRVVRVGLLDSGIIAETGIQVVATRCFHLDENQTVTCSAATTDVSGHGSILAQIITGLAPSVEILSAQVFDGARPSSPAVVAAGLKWLVEEGAEIVNMSFGLVTDRNVLRSACKLASPTGVVLLAAAAARGHMVFPAAYPNVIAVTGDARCAVGELSCLQNGWADIGACPGGLDHKPHHRGGGASFAVAHVTGFLARSIGHGAVVDNAFEFLQSHCSYFGRERRTED